MSSAFGSQSLGARSNQEDAFRIVPPDSDAPDPDLLLLLADGMGGHVGGEIAANLVLDSFEQHCIEVSQAPRPRQRMAEAMEAANAALGTRVAGEPALAGMGATLLATIKLGDRLSWLSVGDSPLYLWRAGSLQRLNADHSVHGELLELVAKGAMTREEADTHPQRNALRSALTGGRIAMVDTNAITLQPGDLVLLASDGVQTLPDARIAEILREAGGQRLPATAQALLDAVAAERRPRQDNATVVLLRHTPVPGAQVTDPGALFHGQEAARVRAGRRGLALSGVLILAMAALALGLIWRPAPAPAPSAGLPPAAATPPATHPVANLPGAVPTAGSRAASPPRPRPDTAKAPAPSAAGGDEAEGSMPDSTNGKAAPGQTAPVAPPAGKAAAPSATPGTPPAGSSGNTATQPPATAPAATSEED